MYQNKVNLIGFLGNDAEVRTANNRSFTTFSLATKSSYKDKSSNQYVSHTEWHHCVVFGKLSEFAKTLTKGAHIQVEGELRSREYTSKKTDTEQRAWEIRVGTILKLDRAEKSAAEERAGRCSPGRRGRIRFLYSLVGARRSAGLSQIGEPNMSFELILPFLRPIERLLLDDSISEIMGNPDSSWWYERDGIIRREEAVSFDAARLRTGLEVIANHLGKKLDEDNPVLHAQLPDGSRLAAVIPPVVRPAPALTDS